MRSRKDIVSLLKNKGYGNYTETTQRIKGMGPDEDEDDDFDSSDIDWDALDI